VCKHPQAVRTFIGGDSKEIGGVGGGGGGGGESSRGGDRWWWEWGGGGGGGGRVGPVKAFANRNRNRYTEYYTGGGPRQAVDVVETIATTNAAGSGSTEMYALLERVITRYICAYAYVYIHTNRTRHKEAS